MIEFGMFELGLIVCGVSISTAAMAVGIGGGILWTPLLILMYSLSPQEAVATSLAIQVAGMASGTLTFFQTRMVIPRLSLLYFLAALPGVIIGGYITVSLSPTVVQLALGMMAMTLAVLFVAGRENENGNRGYRYDHKQAMRLTPIPGILGFLMGTLSVGLGEWLIPLLRNRLGLAMTGAIAVVVPTMFLLALTASVVHWSVSDNLHMECILWGSMGTLIGGQIGPRISRRINERLLKQSFIYLMTLVGIHLIFQAI